MQGHARLVSAVPAVAGLALFASAVSASAQEAPAASCGVAAIGGGFLQLVVAVIQLCVSLTIVAFAVNKGLTLLTGLLNKAGASLDFWQEIRSKNTAVALIGAGVIISYCNVIGSGINSMSNVLGNLVSQSPWQSFCGLLAAIVNLVVAISVASFAITVVFKVMSRFTSGMDDVGELKANNIAVGAIYCGLIIGVSFLVSSGVTSIGLGVNALLRALLSSVGLV